MTVNESSFPNMNSKHYEITSAPTERYNCIAWAAGVDDQWWDPDEDYPWPDDLPRDADLDTLIMLYEGLGYDLCSNADLEDGYEKVALYGKGGEYEHATRQLPDGRWTSKLGKADDITHDTAERLEGPLYGQTLHILKRPTRG